MEPSARAGHRVARSVTVDASVPARGDISCGIPLNGIAIPHCAKWGAYKTHSSVHAANAGQRTTGYPVVKDWIRVGRERTITADGDRQPRDQARPQMATNSADFAAVLSRSIGFVVSWRRVCSHTEAMAQPQSRCPISRRSLNWDLSSAGSEPRDTGTAPSAPNLVQPPAYCGMSTSVATVVAVVASQSAQSIVRSPLAA